MKVIINGDDFGYDKKVNEAICDLISEGRITSATLIANAPEIEDAIQRIPIGAGCSFGVHLNLTEFEPLTPRKDRGALASCLDEKGCFVGEEHLRSMQIDATLRNAVFLEWRYQVEAIVRRGIEISHFDSHNHVHTIPSLFLVLKRLQRYFGIRKVRTSWNIFPPENIPSWRRMVLKSIWNSALRYCYATKTTAGFSSFDAFVSAAKVRSLSCSSVEVMVHPGHQSFAQETKLLRSNWQDEIPFPVRLISYHDI